MATLTRRLLVASALLLASRVAHGEDVHASAAGVDVGEPLSATVGAGDGAEGDAAAPLGAAEVGRGPDSQEAGTPPSELEDGPTPPAGELDLDELLAHVSSDDGPLDLDALLQQVGGGDVGDAGAAGADASMGAAEAWRDDGGLGLGAGAGASTDADDELDLGALLQQVSGADAGEGGGGADGAGAPLTRDEGARAEGGAHGGAARGPAAEEQPPPSPPPSPRRAQPRRSAEGGTRAGGRAPKSARSSGSGATGGAEHRAAAEAGGAPAGNSDRARAADRPDEAGAAGSFDARRAQEAEQGAWSPFDDGDASAEPDGADGAADAPTDAGAAAGAADGGAAGAFALRIDRSTLTILSRWTNFANGVRARTPAHAEPLPCGACSPLAPAQRRPLPSAPPLRRAPPRHQVLLMLLGPIALAISASQLAFDKMVLAAYVRCGRARRRTRARAPRAHARCARVERPPWPRAPPAARTRAAAALPCARSLFGVVFSAQELRVEPVVSWLRKNFQLLSTHGGRAAFLLLCAHARAAVARA